MIRFTFPYSAIQEVGLTLQNMGLYVGHLMHSGTRIIEAPVTGKPTETIMVGVMKIPSFKAGPVLSLLPPYAETFKRLCAVAKIEEF